MPFPSILSAPQKATLRASGYWARVLCVLNTNEVVFIARASQTINTQPFIQFTYDTVTVGAYTDCWAGMILYLSSTSDIRDAYYRGRVRLAPTSGVMYVDENASILTDNDFVIITRDTDLFSRIRRDTLVDGSVTFHKLPDVLADLPSVIVLYDSDNDGSVAYTTIQTPIHVDEDSTSTTTWAWSVSGAGTSIISNAAVQNPTLTFEAGYHYLIRVVHTNNLGIVNYQISHVYAVTRTFDAPVVQPVIAGSINGDIEDGWTASLTAYADVSTLLDRTHCAVFAVQHFGDNSSDPIVSNVLMNGRIRSDSIQTEASAEAGRIQQVTFAVEGITAYLRRLRIPNDIIRPDATPTQWGEIEQPNPFRMVIYALWVYTTLTNISSVSVETGAFEDWQIGGEPRGIDGGAALDVLTSLLDTIKAAPNYAPTGEIHLARTVSYLADRSGVDTITTFEQQDIREYTIDRDSSRTTAQVIAFGGVFDSVTNKWVLYTAQAPSIVYGDGGETRELTREILIASSTIAAAQTEIGGRASNDFAYQNPKPLMRLSLFDSYAGLLIPTNYQRWVATIAASTNTLGIAYGASDYWQLQSVSLTINPNGTIDTSGEWPAETSFDDAQVLASLLPNNLSNMNPVLPILPNDYAFPTDPLENYPTDTPALDELGPIDPDSAAQAYTPFPPDIAAQVAQRVGKAGCKVLQPLFSNSSNTTSSWTTVNTDPYLLTVEGFAQVSAVGWTQLIDFDDEDGSFVQSPTFPYGVYTPPWDHTDALVAGVYRRAIAIQRTGLSSTEFTHFALLYDLTKGTYESSGAFFNVDLGGTLIWSILDTALTSGTNLLQTWDGSLTATSIGMALSSCYLSTPTYDGLVKFKSIYAEGEGVNPFTGAGGTDRWADAFYSWELNDEGEEINVTALGPSEGLFLDNSLFTPVSGVPPYNPSHRYADLPFTGTGNVLLARMVFASYAQVQKLYLTLEMCKVTS